MVESHIVHEMMNKFVIQQIFIVITRVTPEFVNEIEIFLTLIQISYIYYVQTGFTKYFLKSVKFFIFTK